jgi:hypothetical protein
MSGNQKVGYIRFMNAWLLVASGIWIFFSGVFILSLALAARGALPGKKGSSVFVFLRDDSSSPRPFEVAPIMLRRNDK